MNQLSDNDIIDFFYENAVRNFQEEWFKVTSTKWYDYVIDLPEKEKITYMIGILDEEVSNGEFNQYFVNGYGQFAKDTILALNKIKAKNTEKLLENALDSVNKNNLDDQNFRKELLLGNIDDLYDNDTLDDYLHSLSKSYFEDDDNLGILLANYIRK